MIRTNVVLLEPDKEQEEVLEELGDACAVEWNVINYERRQRFFAGEKFDRYPDYKEFSERVGSSTAQQIIIKNNEAWNSFFSLLKKKKKGKLPSHITKISPPRYWKDRESGKRKYVIVLRNDCYSIKGDRIRIPLSKKLKKRFGNLVVKFKGKLRWRGKQKRMEIVYDDLDKKWYAHQSVEAKPLHQPKGDKIVSVDVGVVNLIASSDGDIYSGRAVMSDWVYWTKKIAKYQSELAENGKKTSKRLRRMFRKRKRRFQHSIKAMVRDFIKKCYDRGVSKIVVGNLNGIRDKVKFRKKENQKIHNFWSFGFIVKRLEEVAEEFGIKVEEVDERGTSKRCSICGEEHKGGRRFRGLYVCKKFGRVLNADLNGARNIKVAVSPFGDSGSGLVAQPLLSKWDYSTWGARIPRL